MSQDFFYKEVDLLRKYQLDSVMQNPSYDEFTNNMIIWQKQFLKSFNIYDEYFNYIDSITPTNNTSLLGKYQFYINKGDYYFFKFNDKNIEANNSYQKAFELAINNKNKQLICESIKKILNLNRFSYFEANTTYKHYLNIYNENDYDSLEEYYKKFYQLSFTFQYGANTNWDVSLEKSLLNFVKNSNEHYLNAKILQLIGSYYHREQKNAKAINYEKRSLKELEAIKFNYPSSTRKIILFSLIRYSLFSGHPSESQKYIEMINSKRANKLEKQYEKYKFFYQSYIDSLNNNYKSAFTNLGKYISLTELQNLVNNKNSFKELETKYQTEKKENENLQLKQDNLISEQKRKQNQNLLLGSIFIIIFGGTIGYLNLKNSKKKRLLAEQQKQLEKQKNLTLLKEQEITTINAMIEGQEKERVRIAEDLHDNIGSVLATLKLHFENLKLNREKKHFNQEELYFKTEGLIDETYKKVRSIAHAKNAGVIANQGLLVAIKIMAEKISSANQLKIEVLDFGLENRIENTIELTVFRIVQELITNIIKHAEAENATISLSVFDDTLNVIVEDDGKGFVYKKENNVDGMGLGSINTRIKHLNGDFTVDSTIGNGTSIIIDIPIT